jgi:pimeloyl-ACP methyl ester carboxylesterase
LKSDPGARDNFVMAKFVSEFISCRPSRSSYHAAIPGLCLILVFATCTVVLAADWPPTLDRKNTTTQTLDGRGIERYTHGARPEWGYSDTSSTQWQYPAARETGPAGQNHNSFYLVFPRRPHRNAPLCVVLHSANRTAFDYLGYQFLNRKIDSHDEPSAVMTGVLDDCYVLYPNSTNDEWWGWTTAHSHSAQYSKALTPTEKRVLDTIAWVMARYKIDRNRVYLSGVSMGGCGALALGLPHGDIFAALLAVVPAGTGYVAFRMGFPPALTPGASREEGDIWTQQISGFGLPDPPIMVDFSAQNDSWSQTQPQLLQAAQAGRLPLVLAWGPFGHTAFNTAVAKYPQDAVALAFPWLEIRKNAAYPSFTNASSNQRPPWGASSTDFDESGQINAYFRWKNQQDKRSKFAMKLWIAHPIVKNPPPAMPDTSTTDITLRRLQSFKVTLGRTYTWRLVRGGRLAASGKTSPDGANLLTIPHVTLSVIPAELSVKAKE